MPLLHGFEFARDFAGGVVTIGNFDGVHRGHRQMLARLRQRADELGVPAIVMTFDPHPIELLRPEFAPPKLCTLEHKAELLAAAGVDAVIAVPTDRALLALSPAEFFSQIVQERVHAAGLVEGPNFCFGKDREGDVETLRALCSAAAVSCDIVEPVEIDGRMISSSAIREEIAAGNVGNAAECLSRGYRIIGTVEHGDERGRELGFPTANLSQIETLIPADGVYAAIAIIDGETHLAAVNIGPNPTFEEERRKVEVHILDFDGDLYGTELAVDFMSRIRDVREFPDANALKSQIAEDLRVLRAVADGATTR